MRDEIEIKTELLQTCIQIKEESIRNTQLAMDDAQESANDYGQPKDRYDSYRAQLMRKRDMLAQQLVQLHEELRHLRQIKVNQKYLDPIPGAVVELNTQKLFISVGIGKIHVFNEHYYAVSPVVPLVQAIKKVVPGKSFVFNGKEIKILKVF